MPTVLDSLTIELCRCAPPLAGSALARGYAAPARRVTRRAKPQRLSLA
jgi:hypothetical protein